jgi:DNA polymerase III delta subunit
LLRLSDPAEALSPHMGQLKTLPEYSRLILVADDEPGDDKSRKFETNGRWWAGAVQKCDGIVCDFKSFSSNALKNLKADAIERGKTLSERAAAALLEMTGGSLSRSLQELEKLLLFVGEKDTIQEADVRAVAVPSPEWSVYKLVDSALAGNPGLALRQLRILVGSVAKAEEAAFSRILPQLSRQLRLVWQARLFIESKASLQDPPPALLARLPEKPRITGERDFVQRNAMQMARKLSFAQLAACFEIVSDTDSALKGLLPSIEPMDTLERMVLKMEQVVGRHPAAQAQRG